MARKHRLAGPLSVIAILCTWHGVRAEGEDGWTGRIQDSPSNYEEISRERMPNLGMGFEEWDIATTGKGEGRIFLTEARGLRGEVTKAFGLSSKAGEGGITVSRKFRRNLEPGETVDLTIWLDWGGGWSNSSKGVDLIDSDGNTLIRLVQREASDIFVGRQVAICPQGGTPIRVSFSANAPNAVEFRARQDNGDDFSEIFQISRAPAGLRFFSNSTAPDNAEKRQLYFGDISVVGEAAGKWDFSGRRGDVIKRLGGAVNQSPGFLAVNFFWFGLLGCGAGVLASRIRGRGRGDLGWFVAIFASLSVLLVAPVWEVPYLPLGDAGAHYKQVSLYGHWPSNDAEYARDLGTPYLTGTVVGGTIAKFAGADFGYRLVLSLSLLAFPLGCLALLKILGLSRWIVWGAFPFAWHYSHIWGFYGFGAAVIPGMAMICLAAHFAKGNTGPWMILAVTLSSVGTALSHAMCWGMFAAVAAVVVVAGGGGKGGATVYNRLTGLGCIFSPVVLALGTLGFGGGLREELSYALARECGPLNISLDRLERRVRELFSFSYGRPSTVVYAVIGVFLLVWPVLGGARVAVLGRAVLPSLFIILFFVLAPNWAFSTWIVYPRIGFILLPASYFTLAAGQVYGVRWFAVCGAALAVSTMVLLENRAFVLSTRADGEKLKEIARRIPPGKNVLLVLERRGENMFGERNWDESAVLPPAWVHVGGWLQDQTGSNFFPDLTDHAEHFVMRRRVAVRGVVGSAGWGAHSWCPANLMAYDYFLVRTGGDGEHDYLGAEAGRVIKLDEKGSWALYGNLRVR